MRVNRWIEAKSGPKRPPGHRGPGGTESAVAPGHFASMAEERQGEWRSKDGKDFPPERIVLEPTLQVREGDRDRD